MIQKQDLALFVRHQPRGRRRKTRPKAPGQPTPAVRRQNLPQFSDEVDEHSLNSMNDLPRVRNEGRKWQFFDIMFNTFGGNPDQLGSKYQNADVYWHSAFPT